MDTIYEMGEGLQKMKMIKPLFNQALPQKKILNKIGDADFQEVEKKSLPLLRKAMTIDLF